MKVKLISHTPNPEQVVAAAAKLCYSNCSIQDLMDGLDEESSRKFLQKLVSMGHESPTEHANFTFAIEGVSRSLLAQITRHRIASFSVQSQRYVCLDSFEYVTPPELEGDAEAMNAFIQAMDAQAREYCRIAALLKDKHINSLMQQGMDKKEAVRKMLWQVRDVAPTLFELAGSPCVKGLCPEGKMSCGKAAEMKQRYLSHEPG